MLHSFFLSQHDTDYITVIYKIILNIVRLKIINDTHKYLSILLLLAMRLNQIFFFFFFFALPVFTGIDQCLR